MTKPVGRRAALSLTWLAAAIAVALPLTAQGGTINMILSDMDVTFFGGAAGNQGSVYDTIGHPGGNLSTAESDEVETVVFETDMNLVGTLMTSPANRLSGDLRIDGVGPTVPLGTFQTGIGSNGGNFGFDWFTASGERLRLGIDKIDMLISNNVFFFNGTATLLDQNLPFGLKFDANQPIAFSYTATLPGIVGGNPASGAMASGALTISGIAIPEPATILLALASFGLIGLARRRAS